MVQRRGVKKRESTRKHAMWRALSLLVAPLRVIIVGVGTPVGQGIVERLRERPFPISDLLVFEQSTRKQEVIWEDVRLSVPTLTQDNFHNWHFQRGDVCFMASSSATSEKFSKKIAQTGCLVIECTQNINMSTHTKCIIPDLNGNELDKIENNIIHNPCCTTIPLALLLSPLHSVFSVHRVVVTAFYPVSHAGNDAAHELFTQTRAALVHDPLVREHFPKDIAFNLLPEVGEWTLGGATREELRIQREMHALLDARVCVLATCIRVPVFVGYAMTVYVTFKEDVTPEKVRDILEQHPRVLVIDRRDEGGYATPRDAAHTTSVIVSRIRRDLYDTKTLAMWVVMDNIRAGPSANAVDVVACILGV